MDSPPQKSPAFFRLDTVWLALIPSAALAIADLLQVMPNDFWWHLRTGQIIVQTGQLPTTDLFSFTAFGQPWINQAWLMQVFYSLVFRAGGLAAIVFSHALLIALGYSLLLRALARFYGVRAGVIASLGALLLGLMNWGVRPQGISILAFGALLALIEAHRHGHSRWIWGGIPLFLLWANAHGAFVFGLAALGAYVAGRLWCFWRAGLPAGQRRGMLQLAVAGLLALAATLLNPQGALGLWRYVLSFVQSATVTQGIEEFAPLTIRTADGAFFVLTGLLLAVMLSRSKLRLTADQWLLLGGFALLALLARRNLIWFGFAAAPLLAAGLRAWRPGLESGYAGKATLNALVLGLLSLLVVLTLPWLRAALPFPPERQQLATPDTPFEAVDFLCETLPAEARLYAYQVFGGYQVWGCPRLPVFIDTRIIQLYPPALWDDYFAIERARFDWEGVAGRYGLTHLFLSLAAQPLAVQAAAESPGWSEIYRDTQAVIFEKTTP